MTHRRIHTGLALALTAGALSPAAALARFDLNPPAGSGGGSNQPAPPVQVVHVTGSDFDWGDAGIGAAGTLGLTMVALGGGMAIGRRRSRATTRQAA